MQKKLIIVESPTKARTIGSILGDDCLVKATMGHVRDLPGDEFGVDIERDFAPQYLLIQGKKHVVGELKQLASRCEDLYVATDEDREGEAIAWHAMMAIDRKPEDTKRVAFHEITPEAVREAFASPRRISMELVNAQQARRILDRIVGYSLSPFLGRYLEKGLSAGRVQSVALRLIADREKEILGFVPQTYWRVLALVKRKDGIVKLQLVEIGGKKLETTELNSQEMVSGILERLKNGRLVVDHIVRTEKKIYPFPPFITSTLQQEASIRLGFASTKTMFIAQQLYEGLPVPGEGTVGLITYMRTDSPSVARPAQSQAARLIRERFGQDFLPPSPPIYRARQSTAQEAHEAIRPTSVLRTPENLEPHMTKEQLAVYRLVWERFVASQMNPGQVHNVRLRASNGDCVFEADSNRIVFEGCLRVWPVKVDPGFPEPESFREGETLDVQDYAAEQQETRPPSRYTEASLIKTLEKHGIGRPSTYAPTIATLVSRGYIRRVKRTLLPLKMGMIVNDVVVRFFPEIVRNEFTAAMEDDLDRVAGGEKDWTALLREFYGVFKPMLDSAYQKVDQDRGILDALVSGGRTCPKCGKGNLVVRRSKYGIFLGCAGYPKCDYKEGLKNDAYRPRHRFKKRSRRAPA